MPAPMTLARYARERNGVPLGHRDSMRQMLARSLGASTLAGFWRYWNPIWSYGLSRFVNRPLGRRLPASLAMLGTFAVSGLIHDQVIMALRGAPAFFFTPWFLMLGVVAALAGRVGLRFGDLPWGARAAIILAYLGTTFGATFWLVRTFGLW